MQKPTLYIDITLYAQNRLNTGIQRVVKEFLRRAIKDDFALHVLYANAEFTFELLEIKEVEAFLNDTKEYQFKSCSPIDIYNQKASNKIFFDIDSVWNSHNQRELLYKKLKNYNFKICNFIYDLIPILFPHFIHEKTKQTFLPYLKAIYTYSDLVFFDSHSAKDDFLKIQNSLGYTKQIKTKVTHLGSDFILTQTPQKEKYKNILESRYILFVATLEPRKQQALVLEAFEILHQTYPELHLVFIGKVGWDVEKLATHLSTHPLKNKNIHHLTDVDDADLENFYKNAFIVTYLSYYEGYGLPVAESLKYANITIVSKNSSLPEVGKDFVEYIENNSKTQLIEILTAYIKNTQKYNAKKEYIAKNYKNISWDYFYNSLIPSLKSLN